MDVPFTFGEDTSDLATYSPAELEAASSSSPDLVGVPLVNVPSDNEALEIPVTGGGSTPEGKLEKEVIDLKDELNKKVEPDNPRIRKTASILASKYPGDHRIDQIYEIFMYLKYGDDTRKRWSYVPDIRGIDSWNYANESLSNGDEANCVGLGDCDDFAILMAAFVESIGGATRIILANNESVGGHAYTEVYLGRLDDPKCQVNEIIEWLQQELNTGKIYGHIDTDTKEVWLNLDWGPDEKGNAHPGGPLFPGDRHDVLRIRDKYGLIPLRMPEATNTAPRLISLVSDKNSPQEVGSVVTWTARSSDSDNDQIQYRFFLNGISKTRWITDNAWTWNTAEADIGDNQIEVRIIDGKNAGPNRFDDRKTVSFNISELKPIPTTYDNRPPKIHGLVPNKPSPQEFGTSTTWIADANDPENDQILYRFFLNGWPMTDWITDNFWSTYALDDEGVCENRTIPEYGDNQIEVQIRDGKHADEHGFDDIRMEYFKVITSASWPYQYSVVAQENTLINESLVYYSPLNISRNTTIMMPISYASTLENISMNATHIDITTQSEALAWYNNGEELIAQGKYYEAIRAYDKAIELNSQFYDAWCGKGNAFSSLGRYDEAIQAYNKAIEIYPNYDRATSGKLLAQYFKDDARYEATKPKGVPTQEGNDNWVPSYHWPGLG